MLPHNAKMPHNVYLEFIDFLTTLSRVNSQYAEREMKKSVKNRKATFAG